KSTVRRMAHPRRAAIVITRRSTMKPAAHPTSIATALAAVFVLALPLWSGCSSKMDPKECEDLRGEAFELLNKAQHCDTDAARCPIWEAGCANCAASCATAHASLLDPAEPRRGTSDARDVEGCRRRS